MTLDVPLLTAFVYIFMVDNFYGWGIISDKRFIAFSIALVLLYSLTGLFKAKFIIGLKILILLIFITTFVFLTTANLIYLRNRTLTTAFINDSALQTEIAGRMLLLGKNPYSESFKETDLAKWSYSDDASNHDNPALYRNVIPPFLIIISAVGFRIFSQALGWFDLRIFILLAYLSLITLSFLKFKKRENLLLFLILVGLNPLFLINMIHGSNDIVVLSLILWSLFCCQKKQIMVSAILLGLSLATKQTAWFITPFYFYFVFKTFSQERFLKFSLISVFMILIIYLPFVIWNPQAIINSLIFFVSGLSSINYPISGYGWGSLLLFIGVIPSIYIYYPFWMWQAGFSILIALFFLKHHGKLKEANILVYYGCLLTGIWFFNRYFNASHLGFLMVLLASGSLWDQEKSTLS